MNKDYNNEVKEKWSNTSQYQEHQEKTKNYSKEKWITLENEMNEIFKKFSIYMKNNKPYTSKETQDLVLILKKHISHNYYTCTNTILLSLGQIYVCDERFKRNIDINGDGTANYVCNAIEEYCENNI